MATGVAVASPANEVRIPVRAVGSVEEPDSVVVEKGDHLWKISERHLSTHRPEQETAPYWLQVIEVNTPSLRSGDPDLIYPGELIVLPEVSGQP